jgi:hypothetical protein
MPGLSAGEVEGAFAGRCRVVGCVAAVGNSRSSEHTHRHTDLSPRVRCPLGGTAPADADGGEVGTTLREPAGCHSHSWQLLSVGLDAGEWLAEPDSLNYAYGAFAAVGGGCPCGVLLVMTGSVTTVELAASVHYRAYVGLLHTRGHTWFVKNPPR